MLRMWGRLLIKEMIVVEENTEIFEHCKHSNEFGLHCEDCKDGYFLALRDRICRSNKEEGLYYKCKVANYNGECSKYIDWYYLSSGDHLCSKINWCKYIRNENECKECNENSCLNKKNLTCYLNYVIDHVYEKIYYMCNYTNLEGTKCESCIENYTLSKEGLCVNNFDCQKFDNNGICTQCKKTNVYELDLCLNKEFGCVESFFLEGCKRCDKSDIFYECTECYEGYKLNENDGTCEKLK